jgi:phage terminase small subunit
MTKLTDKQEIFCREYIKDFNGSRASIKAGYSSKGARQNANLTMSKPYIKATIKELMNNRNKRMKITADMVVQELAKIAFSSIDDLGDWDDKGNFILKPSTVLTDEVKASIKNITGVTTRSDGETRHEIKVTREDKIKALELLARHTGAFNADESNKNVINVTVGKKKP